VYIRLLVIAMLLNCIGSEDAADNARTKGSRQSWTTTGTTEEAESVWRSASCKSCCWTRVCQASTHRIRSQLQRWFG